MKLSIRLASTVVSGAVLLSATAWHPAADAAGKKTTKAKSKMATKDIVDTAVAAGSFDTLAAALKAAGLVDTLKGKGPFTVFAPTDAAFGKIPKATLDALIADKKKLTEVLTYHVVAGRVPAATVLTLNGRSAATVNGAGVSISVSGGNVALNGNVKVTAVDVAASNGVIHVIDSVLLPPGFVLPTSAPATAAKPALKDIVDTAVAAGSFKTLATALTAAGLIETLKGAGPFTVFAPTDAAFAKIPKADLEAILADKKKLTEILTYHVVAGKLPASTVVALDGTKVTTVNGATVAVKVLGGKVTLNGTVNVTATDIEASNGIIHVIDSVLLPPPAATPIVAGTIVDVANRAGSFKTLLTAVEAASLTSTLQGSGPFTVLAPTDAAFNLLQPGTLETLLKPESKATLTKILTLHVLAGRAPASVIVRDHSSVTTLNGQKLPVSVRNGRVFIGNALVQVTDISASNGIIHVIDTVLLPN